MEGIPISPTKELFSTTSPHKNCSPEKNQGRRTSRSNSINSLQGSTHGKVISSTKIVKSEEPQAHPLERSLKAEKNKNEMLEKINTSLQLYIEEIEKKVEEKLSTESKHYDLQSKLQEMASHNEQLVEMLNETQNSDFHSKIEELETHIFSIEQQKQELEVQNDYLHQELMSKTKLSPKKSPEKVDNNLRLEAAQAEINDLRGKFREKDKEYFKTKELLSYFENQIPQLKIALENKDNQIKNLIVELEELSSEAKILEENNTQIANELNSLKSQPHRIEVSSMKKKEELDDVSLNFSQFDEKDETKALKELNIDLCEQIEKLKARLMSKEKEILLAKGNVKADPSKLQEYEIRLKRKDEIILDLQCKLKKLPFHDKSHISNIPQLDNISCLSEQFQSERNKLLSEISSAKSSKKSIKAELASSNKSLEKYKSENSKLSKKLSKYTEEVSQWRNYYYSSYNSQSQSQSQSHHIENKKENTSNSHSIKAPSQNLSQTQPIHSQHSANTQNHSYSHPQSFVHTQPLQNINSVPQYPQKILYNQENQPVIANSNAIPVYSKILYTKPVQVRSPVNYNRIMKSPAKNQPQYSLSLNESNFSMYETTEDERALISKYEV